MSALGTIPAAALALLVLAGCGTGTPFGTFADSAPVLKGTVDYRERLALPPDSMLVISLTDTSPVIVTTRIVDPGRPSGDHPRQPEARRTKARARVRRRRPVRAGARRVLAGPRQAAALRELVSPTR